MARHAHLVLAVLIVPAALLGQTASSITLTASPNPANYGQSVTLTASPTAGATGTVLFLANGLPVGTVAIQNGQANLTTPLLPAGLLYLQAVYSGDASHAPSSSTEISQTVRAAPANAFAPVSAYSTGTGPIALAMGDLNGDRTPDLVTANGNGNTVSVLLGRGDGTFGPHTDYEVGSYPNSVVIADFNNDGRPDIATVNNRSQNITVLLGNGDGTFQNAITPPPFSQQPTSLAASDFNGDGNVDLVVFLNDYAPSGPWLLLGNGDGTFQPPLNLYPYASSPGVVGDFNRDGKIDVLLPNGIGLGNGAMLLGNGDGTFQDLSVPETYAYPTAGDLNGDGIPDVVTTTTYNGLSGAVGVFLGKGDGTFQAPAYYSLANYSPQQNAVLLADVNGAGKLDIVTFGDYCSGSVLYGNGDGTFQPPVTLPTVGTLGCGAAYPFAATAGDFNGDGRADLAILPYNDNSVAILLGTQAPILTVASAHSDPFYAGQSGATYSITVTNTGRVATSGTITLDDALPLGVTATNIQGSGWSCTLATLTCTNSTALSPNTSYSTVTLTVSPTAAERSSNLAGVQGGGATASAVADDPTTIVNPPVTIQTEPAGLQFSIDNGATQTAPQTVNLAPGTHTIAVASPQAAPGSQYIFINWSDSGAPSHTITVSTPATYTATFKIQYQLTTAAYPQSAGSVTPASGTYYDSGTTVTLTAIACSNLVFTGWSGGGASNPLQTTMNAPASITAYFDVPGATCTVTGDTTSSAADVQFIVNEALGIVPANNDLNNDGVVNIADVQKVIGAAMNLGCLH